MCGLTGMIFGEFHRSDSDYKRLCEIFTEAFYLSEERGYHASGVSTLSLDGKHFLHKSPIPPSVMVTMDIYNKVLSGVCDSTTILMGHSRWKTVGTELDNANNQPIVAGPIIGTHNGTIKNHNILFKSFQFKRFAEVDSEVLFRMAESSLQEGIIQTSCFNKFLSYCIGSLSFVFVSKTDPKNVYLYHGDKPLFLYYNRDLQVLFYSSSNRYIESSIFGSTGWEPLYFPENKMYQTNYSDFTHIISESFFYQRGCRNTTQLMLPYFKNVI